MILYPRLSKHPFFTENVYNLVHVKEDEIHQEKPLFRSKYNSGIKKFYKEKKSVIPRTMGYTETPLRPPQDYLKKRSGEKKLLSETKSVPCICRETRKTDRNTDQPWDESPVILKQATRNFVAENSLQALRRPATAPEPRFIDDRKGHNFELAESGWAPKYIQKEDYGKKPKYVESIEKQLEESRARFRDFLFAEKQMTTPVKMSEETKTEIYEGLVRNWKELLRRYLTLPVLTETPLQLRRKLEIERRIDSLERDIELLIRNKDIFIGKNC